MTTDLQKCVSAYVASMSISPDLICAGESRWLLVAGGVRYLICQSNWNVKAASDVRCMFMGIHTLGFLCVWSRPVTQSLRLFLFF